MQCLNKVVSGWDVAGASPELRSSAFGEMSSLLCTVLAVPKSSNLRQESLKALKLGIRYTHLLNIGGPKERASPKTGLY